MPNTKMIMTHMYGPVKVSIGDIVTFNHTAVSRGVVPNPGYRAEVFCWHWDHADLVGLRAYDPEYIEGWNDLDEEVEEEQGYWLEMDILVDVTDIAKRANPRYIIRHDINFKGLSLKGRECKLLARIQNTELSFIDLGEDVGGCSADGLGPRGHCIAIPHKSLEHVNEKKNKLSFKKKS